MRHIGFWFSDSNFEPSLHVMSRFNRSRSSWRSDKVCSGCGGCSRWCRVWKRIGNLSKWMYKSRYGKWQCIIGADVFEFVFWIDVEVLIWGVILGMKEWWKGNRYDWRIFLSNGWWGLVGYSWKRKLFFIKRCMPGDVHFVCFRVETSIAFMI